MKIFYNVQSVQGRVMFNIAKAVKQYSPKNITWVNSFEECDLVIENIYGDHKTVKAANNDEIMKHITEKPYGVLFHGFGIPNQHILSNEFFKSCFGKAKFIYSAWDLNGSYGFQLNNFMRGAYGINDEDFFKIPNTDKKYTIACTGSVAPTEAIQEIYEAVKLVNGKMLHLGHNFNFDSKHYENRENVSIEEVRMIFNSSKYVSGLRRAEGFELPTVEAGACGSVPICFDTPHYTDWFNDFALFIKEDVPLFVINQLADLFSKPYTELTEEKRIEIKTRFDWKTLCGKMWDFIGGRI